uniref:Uncharacterized protein n=1 Tax=Cucumis melo TaxID=3656 RepID=A0A9I9CNE0_CUCME
MENMESKKNRSSASVGWRKESPAMAEVEEYTPRTNAPTVQRATQKFYLP